MPQRRTLALALLAPAAARAQGNAYPDRTIRLVVGFAPGGSTDAAARILAPKLGEILGQAVVVENRPGAGGNVATELVARAAADGHTLLLGTVGPLTVNPVIYPSLGFDPARDLVPVSVLVDAFNVLVVPAARPWRAASELVAAARARPGGLSWGYSGVGTSGHLAGLLLDRRAGIETVGVPYRGGGPLMTDLVAGRLDYSFATAPTALPQVEGGQLRALAVPTARRSRLLPEVPTVAETGVPGYDVSNSYGLLAPRGTPPAVVAAASAAVGRALAVPEVAAALARQGLEAQPSSPEQFAALLRAESARWRPIVESSGMRPE